MGYEIISQNNLGHKLLVVPDKLYPEEIQNGLKTKWLGRNIDYQEEVESTNFRAKKLAVAKTLDGTLVISEEQNKGKGRRGKYWFSPPQRGIYFSLILRPSLDISKAPPITMLAAVAMAMAIKEACGLEVGIKWPNDILFKEKKLCGILTEMSAEIDKIHFLIVGIGLNINGLEFPEDLEDIATSLEKELGKKFSRVALLQEFLCKFELMYEYWLKNGFADILEKWKKLCISLNCKVKIISFDKTLEGFAEDVDKDGSLLLRLNNGEIEKIISGEVSLRF